MNVERVQLLLLFEIGSNKLLVHFSTEAHWKIFRMLEQ